MAKINIFDKQGKKVKEINSTLFESPIRFDLVQKIVEAQKYKHPYSPYLWAGMETSASGNVKHLRHSWKSDRGKGMARYPKKRMSDKGDRFVWVAAVIPGVRKGRRAHPPKILRRELKINKKELKLGFLSALAINSSVELFKKKYSKINDKKINLNLPVIVEDNFTKLKAKDFFDVLNNILGEDFFNLVIQTKKIRPGIGKMRSRRYKKSASLLFILGNNQEFNMNSIESTKVKDIKLIDLVPNGPRLTIFTEEAIKDLEKKIK